MLHKTRNECLTSREKLMFTCIWFFLILTTAWFSQGWLQPDEHARVLEPAHQIAYGYATLPWEIRGLPSIVSFFLGTLISPILLVTKLFDANGLTEAFLVRFFVGLLSSTRLIALLRIFKGRNLNPSRHFLYLVICALAVFGPYIFVRTSQENFAATALLWAYAIHFDILKDAGAKRSRVFIFGILLAVATSARLQVGPAAAGLGLFVTLRTSKKIILPAAFGLLVGLLPMAIVDYLHTGTPFSPAWYYLKYALGDEQGGHVWGTSPWWFYFQEFFTTWYPPINIILFPVLLVGLILAPGIGAVFVPFTLIHIILSHKETRYFGPMIPFMQVATFVGWEWLEKNRADLTNKIYAWPKTLKTLFYGFLVVGILGGFVELNTSPEMYQQLSKLLRQGEVKHYTYIGNTRSRPAQFYLKIPDVKPEGKLTLDDAMNGATIPNGWLVIYAADPIFFDRITVGCDVKYVGLSKFERDFLMLLPRTTPIRRRINAVIWCEKSKIIERM